MSSISDFDFDEEVQGSPGDEGEDKKLEELWSKKVRRRSSQLKRLVGDYLDLKEHPKITLLLAKNSKLAVDACTVVFGLSLCGWYWAVHVDVGVDGSIA